MPDEPRRIILEKSRTVRRRYQRSNQRFRFTASQVQRIEREQERERRAKQLREKEKKRVANKKRKAEQEAHAREERRRRGLPDPHAASVPASQPLLSKFLGPVNRQSSIEAEPTTTETDDHSDGGDTEVDSEAFDLDGELEHGLSEVPGAVVVPAESRSPDVGVELQNDDDEFSECSAFYDEEIMKEAEAAAPARPTDDETKEEPPSDPSPSRQPPPNDQSRGMAGAMASFGDSFRDETADFLEEIVSRGCGESFSELIQLDSRLR